MVFSTQSFHYYVRTSSLFLFASMFLILHLYRKKFRFLFTVVKPICSLKSLNESVITEKRARFEQVPFKLYDDTICCLNSTKTFLLCMSSPHPATRYFVCRFLLKLQSYIVILCQSQQTCTMNIPIIHRILRERTNAIFLLSLVL